MISSEFANTVAIIATLVVLEGLLSADNALVLAILVKHLPKDLQKKALRYGIAGAFIFRAIGVVTAAWLMHYWEFKAAGAAYLLYLTIKHFIHRWKHRDGGVSIKPAGPGFWKTILLVELTDVAFSVDSIVAAVAMSKKIWIVYLGGILGIITMRFVAGLFLRLLEKFPKLEDAAYLLVGWIGIKLGLETVNQILTGQLEHGPYLIPAWLFWPVMLIILVGGLLWPNRESEMVEHASDLKEFEKEESDILSPHHHS
jgi:YkoY family integral membrane protein